MEDLAEGAIAWSSDRLEAARRVALSEPLLLNRVVPESTHVVGINVTLQLPGDSPNEVQHAATYARDLADSFQRDRPGVRTYLTGIVMLNNAFTEAAVEDVRTLMPLMFLIIVAIMGALLRSVSGTLASLAVIGMSTAAAMGIAGWLGIPLTTISVIAPTMILTLAIADSIHVLVVMLREMRQGHSKHDALVESLRVNIQPILLTSLTTAIGFLSMNLSDVPPFRDLGNITALGIAAAFVYSILFLPALLAVLPISVRAAAEGRPDRMDGLADFVVGHRRALLWGSAALVLGLALFVPRNELSDEFVRYFDESIRFRTDSDFASENLSGIYQIEFSVGSGESGGISEPEYLRKLDDFAEWYRAQPGVVHVGSFSDVMKRLNKNMHSDQPEWYALPDHRELAAQYLLLYEMSLPYGLDLNNQISLDKSATRLVVTLEDLSSTAIRATVEAGEEWLQANAPSVMRARGVGPGVMFAYISQRNIRSMLTATGLALVVVAGTLMIALRSVKFGLISLIPNLAPALLGFGLWGALVGQVNLGLSIVTGMTLGIVVDDSVHLLSKYLRGRREKGLSTSESVRYALASVGQAMIVTTLILAAGFGVLSLSAFDLNAGMGKLTAITIVFALGADILFLPPLLMRMDRERALTIRRKEVTGHAEVPVAIG